MRRRRSRGSSRHLCCSVRERCFSFHFIFSLLPRSFLLPPLVLLLLLLSRVSPLKKKKKKNSPTGALAGGAGKVATDPLLAAAGHPPSPAAEFSNPGFSLRSAALGALWQAVSAHWAGFLTERQAGAALALVLVAHGAAVDVHSWWLEGKGGKRAFDFTAAPAALLHALSRVPAPIVGGGGGGRGGEAKKQRTTTTRARSAARMKSA